MIKQIIISGIILFGSLGLSAQGPPITADKPIMLGHGQTIIKTLTQIRVTENGTYTKIPLMAHYLPSSNSLVAIHLPYTSTPLGSGLGDIGLMGKYQFFRKDGRMKTFRMVLKTIQYLPTGPNSGELNFGIGEYQAKYGITAGYETLRHGVSAELLYHYVGGPRGDVLHAKLGFGVPFLKPVYPVKQLNLYFENGWEYYLDTEDFTWLFGQGIQYARKQWTFEAAIQLPMIQSESEVNNHRYTLFLGTRFIF